MHDRDHRFPVPREQILENRLRWDQRAGWVEEQVTEHVPRRSQNGREQEETKAAVVDKFPP
jgi:hypothetical protein